MLGKLNEIIWISLIDHKTFKAVSKKQPFLIYSKMTTNEKFEDAVKRVHSLDTRPSNENLLKLYGLYKQATEGDVLGDRPGGFDFKAIAKYDSWASLREMSKEEAMQGYVDLVDSLSE